MLIGQSRNNRLHWHALIDGYLFCQQESMARINSIRDYSPSMYMCQRCIAKLDRIDPIWHKQVEPKNVKDMLTKLRG